MKQNIFFDCHLTCRSDASKTTHRMEQIMKNSKIIPICLVMTAFFLAGCGTPGPRAWNISIDKSTVSSIRVDLIGVTESEKPYWEGYNIDKYWIEGDQRRKDANPLSAVLKKGQPWVISMNDPKWQAWLNRGATELLVVADLPGHFDAGPADPRRRFLPLTKGLWITKNDTLEIEIQNTMILPLTPMKPK